MNGLKANIVKIVLFLFFVFGINSAQAETERILSFDSQITIHSDASMTVVETIKVVALGKKIKRGIYRDFPTKYKNKYGDTVRVQFNVEEVLRDGIPEAHHIVNRSNGERVYFGNKGKLLQHGEYTYTLRYTTNRQLGFFKDFDELYWNVTGQGWAFPIDEVTATVMLPIGAILLQSDAYTGKTGSQGKNYTSTEDILGNSIFQTTKSLNPHEGLTISVAWPKGFVDQPTTADKWAWYANDNASTVWGGIFFIAILIYYFVTWVLVGRDLPKGTIIPLFYPPKGFSPAATQYIYNMGFGLKKGPNTAFAAALMNMAVKGIVKIKEDDGTFTIEKVVDSNASKLSKGERTIVKNLFKNEHSVEMKNKNHSIIGEAFRKFQSSVKVEFEGIYFITNSGYFFIGILITILALGANVINASDTSLATFMTIWLSMWSLAVFMMLAKIVRSFSGKQYGAAFFMLLFAIPFLAGEGFGLYMLVQATSIMAAVSLFSIMLLNFVFYQLLKAPTVKGRRVMDKIEGFKMYLSVAEKLRFQNLHPPDVTPELFEKYLPYALALGVEHEWSEKFSQSITITGKGQNYQPLWYHGTSWNEFGAGDFANNLGGSLAGAISSSSTAPGSSSGSGGGGFSGGGGGGGGGGGW
ncbi:MAG: DUF2207 domain-containing protein [Nitrospinales bacterium]